MSTELSTSAVGLFLLVVFPGLISARVYRLLMPARELQSDGVILEGLFYSAVNFVLTLPILLWIVLGHSPYVAPGRFAVAGVLMLLVGPVLWPVLLVKVFRADSVRRRIHIPYPTAWDFYFDRRRPAFAIVHLTSGALLGAYWGEQSHAGLFPNDGDIYFEAVYSLDASNRLAGPLENTQGVLLRKDQYTYIEFIQVPTEGAPA